MQFSHKYTQTTNIADGRSRDDVRHARMRKMHNVARRVGRTMFTRIVQENEEW